MLHPDLTDERLQFLASLFVRCRAAALEKHDPEAGEDAWCLGCRCYARICTAIVRAAADGQSWLTILQDRIPGQHFIFEIGEVPFRFYTGQPSRPTARTRKVDSCELLELKQLHLPLEEEARAAEWFWRLAIGVKADGNVGQVCVLQVTRRGSVRHVYSVPFEGAVKMENTLELLAPAIEIDEAEVALIDEVADQAANGEAGSTNGR